MGMGAIVLLLFELGYVAMDAAGFVVNIFFKKAVVLLVEIL
jgi:hypothetical protein